MQKVWHKCDPTLNKDCKKTSCFINGGECHHTSQEEFKMKTQTGMQVMLDKQAELQMILGTDFEEMSMEERAQFARNHFVYLNQELNEALYELPYFKAWKNYDGMTVDEMANQIKKYKEELVDAWHFFMNLMLVVDMDADELQTMYFEKHAENIARQERGYTHDVSYRE